MYLTAMFLWLFFLGNVSSSPTGDELFRSLINEGELALNDEAFIKHILPGVLPPQKPATQITLQLEDDVKHRVLELPTSKEPEMQSIPELEDEIKHVVPELPSQKSETQSKSELEDDIKHEVPGLLPPQETETQSIPEQDDEIKDVVPELPSQKPETLSIPELEGDIKHIVSELPPQNPETLSTTEQEDEIKQVVSGLPPFQKPETQSIPELEDNIKNITPGLSTAQKTEMQNIPELEDHIKHVLPKVPSPRKPETQSVSVVEDDFKHILPGLPPTPKPETQSIPETEDEIKPVVPEVPPPQKPETHSIPELEDIIDKDNEHYKILSQHFAAGHTLKGLTFTIYDDNMREAAVALFRILQNIDESKITIIREWARKHINKDILEYALRLTSLHRRDDAVKELEPPFVTKPNLFLNSETIHKALMLKIHNGNIDPQEEEIYQIFKEQDLVIINTNYSGWNQQNLNCIDYLDYFRQDIGLNSYYYGMHLLYPFWMSNNELSAIDSRYAEHYYYIHRHLMARYKMEKQHLFKKSIIPDSKCYDDFIPNLSYENGLPFPSRSSVQAGLNEEQTRMKSIDIAIKECITRGVIFMENGTKVDLTEENYVELLTKLIRANYESIQAAKSLRALLGYGGNGYLLDSYNPAPSVLHHPQTTLRDPFYWTMIEMLLKYYKQYSHILPPYDFSRYQSEDIAIIGYSIPRITTYFDYYQISMNNVFRNYDQINTDVIYTARQKRIKHLPFNFSFSVDSKVNKTVLVKLFLGPSCEYVRCWDLYSEFYELDAFTQELEEGLNIVKWSSETSSKYSIDDYFNVELKTSRNNRFNMFKFPENMIIPQGLNNGLNATLFLLVVPESATYKAPLGFPFHRQALINYTETNNYKFYTISIYHKENTREMEGYYSPHLN
ncbi:arylphorin subunit alpha-like [Bicyclus anynana]|uniref:Arylphorin subunit alpha-like n=1 Tax=Bicyclus anynana TaxID=110368 RepID=A0A6J1MN13_BICAN|nr:arylphorin subunit alpha-like [Bicyclus anynana]